MLIDDWLEAVEEAIELFKMSNKEKIQYASYLMRDYTKVQWKAFRDAQQSNTIAQATFREAFEREFLGVDMQYVKT